jgi:phosphatidylglycerophosphate synthase
MNPGEEKIYYSMQKRRDDAFKPLSKLFTRFGLSADMISYLGVIFMVLFVFALPSHHVLAFLLLFLRMMADILDGPLARYQKTDSDRGKFVDVLMDNLAFALFIFGTVRFGLIHGLTGSLYLFITELLIVLMIIRYNFKDTGRWFFYASAGALPYSLIYGSYVLFSWWAFGGHNRLNGSAQLFTVVMLIQAAREYWVIQGTRKKN